MTIVFFASGHPCKLEMLNCIVNVIAGIVIALINVLYSLCSPNSVPYTTLIFSCLYCIMLVSLLNYIEIDTFDTATPLHRAKYFYFIGTFIFPFCYYVEFSLD